MSDPNIHVINLLIIICLDQIALSEKVALAGDSMYISSVQHITTLEISLNSISN